MKLDKVIPENGVTDDRETLLLHDVHREYTGDFGDNNWIDSDLNGDCEFFWDTYGVSHTLAELRQVSEDDGEALAHKLMPEIIPPAFIEREGGPEYVYGVWRLTGSRAFLEMKFEKLLQALKVDSTWGDDDSFDYWPNTMDMLWDFALDLDGLEGQWGGHKAAVTEVARHVFEGTIAAQWGPKVDGTKRLEEIARRHSLFGGEWGDRDWFPSDISDELEV